MYGVPKNTVGLLFVLAIFLDCTWDAFLSISWSFPRVPHHNPESLAWSFGILLFRKWGKCVDIGSKIDSGGTFNIFKHYLLIILCNFIITLFVSFLYHFFRSVVSLLMASKTSINFSSSSVTISDGIGLYPYFWVPK